VNITEAFIIFYLIRHNIQDCDYAW